MTGDQCAYGQSFIFVDVNLVTMRDPAVLARQTVVVADGLIQEIGDAAGVALPAGSQPIDGAGRYLMPGLVDMHVHLGESMDDLPLYLANGVTTIRNMWGIEGFGLARWLMGTRVFDHLQLRDRIRDGAVLGPRVVTAGPLIEGDRSFFPRFLVVRSGSAHAAEQIVRRQAEQGFDLVKFYSSLSSDAFDGLVRAARERNLPCAGHLPDPVGIRNAVRAHVTSLEHLLGFFNPYDPGLAIHPSEVGEVARLSADHGVFHCPTLVASERLADAGQRERYEHEEAMRYVSGRVVRGMRMLQDASRKHFAKRGAAPNHTYLDFLYRVVDELKRAGARILLGTDKGTPYVVAGFSVHRELEHLARAGLSPYEALTTATVNAAACLRLTDEIGTVETGKRADLLLVDGNPLADLRTVERPHGVMVRGRWLDRAACDRMLTAVLRRDRIRDSRD